PAGARDSAVLVLLIPANNGTSESSLMDWRVVLIKRNTYEGVHSGQIAFPGGKCEKTDKGVIDTAYREAFEELGIVRENTE
ncbi:MAG TPA: coenzyme A pyrophosphatase, partial [Rikenellaceae bacterium]|nr:coenzyme A pyrophosphatase [Rikenellaceae bacterium]